MAKAIDLDCGVGELGPAGFDFERRFLAAAGVCNAALGALVALVREALEEGYWAGHGIHSPVHWLMWRGGLSRGTARAVVRLALRSHELPTTMGLLTEGRLSLDQAAVSSAPGNKMHPVRLATYGGEGKPRGPRLGEAQTGRRRPREPGDRKWSWSSSAI